MIELLILGNLVGLLGRKAKARGHTPGKYQGYLVVAWLLPESVVGFALSLYVSIYYPEAWDKLILAMYAPALLSGALGAWLVFRLVDRLPVIASTDGCQVRQQVLRFVKS